MHKAQRGAPHIHSGNLLAGDSHAWCCFDSHRQKSNVPLPGTSVSLWGCPHSSLQLSKLNTAEHMPICHWGGEIFWPDPQQCALPWFCSPGAEYPACLRGGGQALGASVLPCLLFKACVCSGVSGTILWLSNVPVKGSVSHSRENRDSWGGMQALPTAPTSTAC